ncbi:hypothetical protein [Methylobacterium sp. JK268]
MTSGGAMTADRGSGRDRRARILGAAPPRARLIHVALLVAFAAGYLGMALFDTGPVDPAQGADLPTGRQIGLRGSQP